MQYLVTQNEIEFKVSFDKVKLEKSLNHNR